MSITVEFDKNIVLEKLLCLGIALLLVLPFSLEVSMWILIVASYGHFFLAHLYQWKRQTPSPVNLVLFFITLGGLFYFCHNYFELPKVIVLTLFFAHCFWDEFKLQGEKTNILSGTLVFSIVSVLSLWLISDTYRIDIGNFLSTWVALTSLMLSGVCLYLFYKSALHLTTNIILLAFSHLLFVSCYFADVGITPLVFFRILIHFHGIGWYLYAGRKYWNIDRRLFNIYIRDVILMNTLFVFAYFASIQWPQYLGFLTYMFYSVGGYYAWGTMHLISTIRFDDYKNFFSLPVRELRA